MIQTESARVALEARYYKAALDYLHSLPLEHFMEGIPHAKQREITLESLALVKARRPDVHVFNELLVQYPRPRHKRPGQVVPDNMVVIHAGPIDADLSFDTPLLSARPFWVLEYVSKSSTRKDYVDNMRRYEQDLAVPFYLLFDPLKQTLFLYRHNGKRFVAIKPNANGRLEIEDLDLEMTILEKWVRFWYKGKLLPLPAELQSELDNARKDLADTRKELSLTQKRAEDAERELAALREQVKKSRSKKNGSH